MGLTLQQLETLAKEGVAALQRGDGRTAHDRLARVAAAQDSRLPPPWLLLAQACRLLGDDAGEHNALQTLLALETRNLPALLLSGDLNRRQGDDRAANAFYNLALSVAAQMDNVPPALHPLLAQAQSFVQQMAGRFEAHLQARIMADGVDTASPRIAQSLDLLFGRTQLYQPQPSMFYFPGLAPRPFFERAEFPWLAAVEAAIPAMQAELAAVLEQDRAFAPYVQTREGRPSPANPLLDDPSWGALYFWEGGRRIAENADRCPATMRALAAAPIPVIESRSPMALYSLLKPGTHIQPHHGLLNTRLICHIPLITPPDCALRVGHETRAWREGEALIFDDSFEHEAWNRSDRTRIILLFEIWRPEITADERAALTHIFEMIDAYQGAPSTPA